MASKLQTTAPFPEAITYTQLKIPLDTLLGVSLNDSLREKISLAIQGEAVEVSEEYPTPILMAVFDIAHRVSPEMVLRLKSGKRVLLFDHWGAPVLRDKDIYMIDKNTAHKKLSGGFVPELVIELGKIWEKTSAKEEDLGAIKAALEEVNKSIKPTMVTTLIGKAPALLFLLTQHLLYGRTGEIWYGESAGSPAIRITQL
jgi:hypothetical protein